MSSSSDSLSPSDSGNGSLEGGSVCMIRSGTDPDPGAMVGAFNGSGITEARVGASASWQSTGARLPLTWPGIDVGHVVCVNSGHTGEAGRQGTVARTTGQFDLEKVRLRGCSIGAGDLTALGKVDAQGASVSWRSADAETPFSPHGTGRDTVAWTVLDLSEREECVWTIDLAGPEKVEAWSTSDLRHSADAEMLLSPHGTGGEMVVWTIFDFSR
ncbi:uncharacterized protein EI90DRAFT_3177801 [Cantharellus anzutake]|uniref:uncharacterized protein n=1 Tax=Cantharellus anzutake TaxID=1750568 RepID=UPI001907D872|nr:uncharacterized protein EI90DRAFT_3177801 [Cantharellus anzutake]KAF8314586.1 hypothetical protein EI90DRAFT_3177801 [Cantharellus anzutake]